MKQHYFATFFVLILTVIGRSFHLLWLGIGVSSSTAVVTLNGYNCVPQAANSTALSCMTTERNAGIKPLATTVFLQGRGYAIISERAEDTVFRRGVIEIFFCWLAWESPFSFLW